MNRAPSRSTLRPVRLRVRSAWTATAVLAAALAISSCGTPVADSAESQPGLASAATLASDASQPGAVRFESAWAKAGSGMTAVFGTVVNATDRDVVIVGGSSPSAADVQVHTMAKQADGSMKMTQKKGGLTVPAGGAAELDPGADHLMLIGLRAPLANGQTVSLVLVTADGARLEYTVPVRSFAGAEENYVPEEH